MLLLLKILVDAHIHLDSDIRAFYAISDVQKYLNQSLHHSQDIRILNQGVKLFIPE